MSGKKESPVVVALQNAIDTKNRRIKKLRQLMSANHLSREDARAHDDLARRINAEPDIQKKLALMDELAPIIERIKAQSKAAIHQSENYTRWMNEEIALLAEVDELGIELFMAKMRRKKQPTETTEHDEKAI